MWPSHEDGHSIHLHILQGSWRTSYPIRKERCPCHCLWWTHLILLSLRGSLACVTVTRQWGKRIRTSRHLSEMASPVWRRSQFQTVSLCSLGLEAWRSPLAVIFYCTFRVGCGFWIRTVWGSGLGEMAYNAGGGSSSLPACSCVPRLQPLLPHYSTVQLHHTAVACFNGLPMKHTVGFLQKPRRIITRSRPYSLPSPKMLLPTTPPPWKQEAVRPLCHKLCNDYLHSSWFLVMGK